MREYEIWASTTGPMITDTGFGGLGYVYDYPSRSPRYLKCNYCGSKNKEENSNCSQCGAPMYVEDNRIVVDGHGSERVIAQYHDEPDEPEGLIARVMSRLFGK